MSGIVGKNLGRGSGLVKVGSVGADSVTGASIADDAIDSEHYTDASIDNAHLADNAVDTQEIADNAITLAKMAGGTDGNIISFDASGDPVAIATGSDGQVLTSTGAGSPPAFEAAAGGGQLVFIAREASASATGCVDFNGCFSTTYQRYLVIIGKISNDNDNVNTLMRYKDSSNNSVSSSTYSFVGNMGDIGNDTTYASASFRGQGSTSLALSMETHSGTTTSGGFLWIWNSSIDDTTDRVFYTGMMKQYSAARHDAMFGYWGGECTATAAHHGLQFFASAGNISDYDISIHGLKHA